MFLIDYKYTVYLWHLGHLIATIVITQLHLGHPDHPVLKATCGCSSGDSCGTMVMSPKLGNTGPQQLWSTTYNWNCTPSIGYWLRKVSEKHNGWWDWTKANYNCCDIPTTHIKWRMIWIWWWSQPSHPLHTAPCQELGEPSKMDWGNSENYNSWS